jgi:pimeloyl-ACP methyl ester carboxylesterase
MQEIELSGGTIEYEDTGGDGPVLVLLHGVAMDGSLWPTWSPSCVPTTAAWCRPFPWALIAAR